MATTQGLASFASSPGWWGATTPQGTYEFRTRWLNTDPGNTGLDDETFKTLIAYVLDGLGLREVSRESLGRGPAAVGEHWAIIYQEILRKRVGEEYRDLPERITAMILREFHKNSPVIFAGLVAAAPIWATSAQEAVADGVGIGDYRNIAAGMAAANALGRADEIRTAAEASAAAELTARRTAASQQLSASGGSTATLTMGQRAMVAAVVVAILAALWVRRSS